MGRLEDEMNTTFGNEKHKMLSNVVFTAHWVKGQFNNVIKPFGLSSPQFNILRILKGAKDWLNMNEIKDTMVEKSPNTTRLCDKLVEKKLIDRSRSDQDRRVVFLKITDMGLKLLKKIDDHDDGSIKRAIENISEEDAQAVNKILDKLRG